MGNSFNYAAKEKTSNYAQKKGKATNINFPERPSLFYGLLLAAAVGTVALLLGILLPAVGGPIFAIILGLVVRNTVGVTPACRPGVKFASKAVLQWSIVLLGFGLSFNQVVQAGTESLWITIATITTA